MDYTKTQDFADVLQGAFQDVIKHQAYYAGYRKIIAEQEAHIGRYIDDVMRDYDLCYETSTDIVLQAFARAFDEADQCPDELRGWIDAFITDIESPDFGDDVCEAVDLVYEESAMLVLLRQRFREASADEKVFTIWEQMALIADVSPGNVTVFTPWLLEFTPVDLENAKRKISDLPQFRDIYDDFLDI